jgi:hypothetical protein
MGSSAWQWPLEMSAPVDIVGRVAVPLCDLGALASLPEIVHCFATATACAGMNPLNVCTLKERAISTRATLAADITQFLPVGIG